VSKNGGGLWGKGVAVWYAWELYDGLPDVLIREAKALGLAKVCPKFGNGIYPWQGLEGLIEEAHREGLQVWGWWYFFGNKDEGKICGDHAVSLGLDGVILDIESHWEGSASTSSARRRKAELLMTQLRERLPDLPIGISSWWKPSYHDVPFEVFLREGFCDLNMQQTYWIGRFDEAGGARLLEESVEEYLGLYDWPPEKSIPILSAFGQSYQVGGTHNYWETTVPQMHAANAKARALGCRGVWWWSWNYMLGKAGSSDKLPRPGFFQAIASHEWGEPGPPPAPPPGPPEVSLGEWANAIDAWARGQGFTGPKPAG